MSIILGDILANNLTTALTQVEQTAQLQRREEELVKQNDRLEQFASIVSHDLRNPLNVAEGYLEIAQTNYQGAELDKVAHSPDRMNDLIDDVLTLARRATG